MAYVLPTSAATGEIGRLRSIVAKYYPVYELRVTPQSLILAVQVDPSTLSDKFDALRQELWPINYIPTIRQDGGETVVEIVRRPPSTNWRPLSNVVLLALTCVTTLFAGAFLWVAYVGGTSLNGSAFLWGGLTFTLPLLVILGVHELAHYLVARHHHVDASLPFFTPMPPPFLPLGTFGAMISLREPIPDRKVLLQIGASGPIAGFALSIPITILGLFLSSHNPVNIPLTNCGPNFVGVPYGDLVWGESALFYGLSLFFPLGTFTSLSPLAIAGWVGLLVTAFNLLPAGQLDGGHVARALLGSRAVWASWICVGALFVMWFVTSYLGWLLFAFVVFILGVRHPPPLNDITPLDLKHKMVGIAAVAILVSSIAIVPLSTPTGQFAIETSSVVSLGDSNMDTLTEINYTVKNQDLTEHAFLLNATVVVGGDNLTDRRAWLLQDSWTVRFSNGTVWTRSGAGDLGNFSTPGGSYIAISPTGVPSSKVNFTIVLSDPLPANLAITVTLFEICSIAWQVPDGGPAVQTCQHLETDLSGLTGSCSSGSS